MPVPGMLRLKGDVTKIHKKKRPDSSSSKASSASVNEGAVDDTISPLWHEEQVEADKVLSRKTTSQKTREDEAKPSHGVTKTDGSVTKTDAELHHEERRRRMLDERLKRHGTKTHKERVEALNRYLSKLSEHHDMPRIGPG